MDVKEEQIELQPASLGRALKRGIADAWDRLGLVIASSFIWSLAMLIPVTVAWDVQRRNPSLWPWIDLAGLAVGVIVGAPLLAGIFRLAHKIVYGDDPSLSDVLAGARELFKSGFGLALANVAAVGVLVTDAAFFFGLFGPIKGSVVFYAFGALSSYLLVVWLMMALYHLPVLAAQGPLGQRLGAVAAIRKSFLLAMHNLTFTIGLFVAILGFSILCVVSVIGVLILYVGTVSILLTHALRELFIRYGIVEEPPEVTEDRGWHVR